MKIHKDCLMCKKLYTMEVSEEGFDMWVGGAHVQDAFPELSKDDRELLISGICGPCFDKLFEEDEEDVEEYQGEVHNTKED